MTFFLSYAIDKGLKKTRYGYFAQWNDLYDGNINADLLILGSSRARQHFNPKTLDSALHLNSYVFGLEAYRFQMQSSVFKIYLQHNIKPKYLILSLDTYTLHEDRNPYYYQQFLPYLNDTLIRQAFKGYSREFTSADFLVPGYKYLGQRTWIIIGLSEFVSLKTFPENSPKGFSEDDRQWDGTFEQYLRKNPSKIFQPVDQKDLKLLDDFLSMCKDQDIKVFMVFSPEYKPAQKQYMNRNAVVSVYRQMASKHQVPFMDFSDDQISSDQSLFYNSQHLNKKGARIFSEKVALGMSSGLEY